MVSNISKVNMEQSTESKDGSIKRLNPTWLALNKEVWIHGPRNVSDFQSKGEKRKHFVLCVSKRIPFH